MTDRRENCDRGDRVRKTFLVTVGWYSDYRVLAVARSEELAGKYAEAFNSQQTVAWADKAEVEEVPFIEHDSQCEVRTYFRASWCSHPYDLEAKQTRRMATVGAIEPEAVSWMPGQGPFPSKRPTIRNGSVDAGVYWEAVGSDRDAVVKALSDRAFRWLAQAHASQENDE